MNILEIQKYEVQVKNGKNMQNKISYFRYID